MIGMRAISDEEYERLKGILSTRDACILTVGMRTGFRISEILSLNIGDVFQGGNVVECIQLNRARLKGKKCGRSVPLHPEARECLGQYISGIDWDRERYRVMYPDGAIPLFQTKNLNRMDRSNYWGNLKKAYTGLGISSERIGTHSMKKAYCKKMYEALKGDLFKIQQATGHKSLDSLVRYLVMDSKEIEDAIKGAK